MYTTRILAPLIAVLLWLPAAYADLDDIRRTAEAGDREAQLELGILFQYGFNYKDNEIPALTWYSLSANQGNAKAVKLRDVLKTKMTEKEVQEAMEQVATFRPKGTPPAPPAPVQPTQEAPAAPQTVPAAPEEPISEIAPVTPATQ